MPGMPVITAAVEGIVDEAVVRRLVASAGATLGAVYGKNGKASLRKSIGGYNCAARYAPWIIIVDLDHDAACAPPLVRDWLPTIAPLLCFRIAVREVEAWLLADCERIAGYLRVPVGRIPSRPETLDDPKEVVVDLARHSRRRDIREDIIPRPGSGRRIGSAYPSRLIEFVSDEWRPEVAAMRCDSLRRTIRCLECLVQANAGDSNG